MSEPEIRNMAPHGTSDRRDPFWIDEVLTPKSFPMKPTEFNTGAKRADENRACLLELIPLEALEAYGNAFGEGAAKYGLHNWLKGFPISNLLRHAIHHIFKYLRGDRSEDHLGHAAWNIGSAIYFSKNRPDLDDCPPYDPEKLANFFKPTEEKLANFSKSTEETSPEFASCRDQQVAQVATSSGLPAEISDGYSRLRLCDEFESDAHRQRIFEMLRTSTAIRGSSDPLATFQVTT